MKVEYTCNKGILQYYFFPEEHDHLDIGKAKMSKKTCEVRLPEDWTLNSVHPDALALSTIMIVYPYIGQKLTLPFGITRSFHDFFKKMTNIDILPIDDSLQTRKAPQYSVPAVAYSGGVDSTAALALLPKTASAFFIDRIIDKSMKTQYKKESAHYACQCLRKLGYSVYMIQSDFEYIRKPVGFVLEESTTVPTLLMSDYVGLDSVAHGIFIGRAYEIYKPETDDLINCHYIKLWSGMFDIVDVSLNLMTIGMTEAGTGKIAMDSLYNDFTQSCVRGKIQKPCLNCIKCLRKKLLELSLNRQEINDSLLSNFFAIRGLEKALALTEYEIDFAYISSIYKGNNSLMKLLKQKTGVDVFDFSWYEKWYGPASQLIPEKYRSFVLNRISEHLETMNPSDESYMKKLNIGAIKSLEGYNKYSNQLNKQLKQAQSESVRRRLMLRHK